MPFLACVCILGTMSTSEEWSPSKVLGAISRPAELAQNARELTNWFGGEKELTEGSTPKIEGLTVAFAVKGTSNSTSAIVVSDQLVRNVATKFLPGKGVVSEGKPFELKLVRVGNDGLFVGATKLSEGDGFSFHYAIDGHQIGNSKNLEVYTVPPEASLMPGVDPGNLEQQPRLTSKVFGGTWHDWWVWTPKGFDPSKESNLAVFQDGQWSHNYAPVYFANMCFKGDLPQTVVVFVTPGTFTDGKSDRSREYDTLSDTYARFLLEELLPPIESKFKITQDPMRRCVAGLSSGGICAFTVAWNRPDKFGLVMSWIGSFTNIASGESRRDGGHNYPALIRKSDPRPIRVFLQDGANDLDNIHGNWPLANREMESALKFKKYDVYAVFGNGFHSDAMGRATMANALRWLFPK